MYTSTLPSVDCREPILPPISIPFIGNVIEQNLVGFPNSMYRHVGCRPYFGSSYRGIGNVFIVWPSMFDPLVKSTT
jgi:hypothetical protein